MLIFLRKKSWFLHYCGTLFLNNHSSIFVDEMFFVFLYANEDIHTISVLLLYKIIDFVEKSQMNWLIVQSAWLYKSYTICWLDRDMREPKIAWYIFFMMPDGEPHWSNCTCLTHQWTHPSFQCDHGDASESTINIWFYLVVCNYLFFMVHKAS